MSDFHDHVAPVLAAERERIDRMRQARGQSGDLRVGLALSGGGIRSASFAMGVTQALDERGALQRIDYLSSVSGGGYTGAALTFLQHRLGRFPFGKKGLGARTASDSAANDVLSYIRQHGDYLAPSTGFDAGAVVDKPKRPKLDAGGDGITLLALIGWTIGCALLSLAVYGSLLVGLYFGLHVLDGLVEIQKDYLRGLVHSPLSKAVVEHANAMLLVALGALLVFACWVVATPIYQAVLYARYRGRNEPTLAAYRFSLRAQRAIGRALRWAAVALLFGSVPIAARVLEQLIEDEWTRIGAAAGSTLLGAVLGGRGLGVARNQGDVGGLAVSARSFALVALLLYGMLLVSHFVAISIFDGGATWTIFVVVGGGLVLGLASRLNDMGPSAYYRDRLMEVFMPSAPALAENRWQPAIEANRALLRDMCGPDIAGPYHLINANLIDVDSEQAKYRGRGGDSFVMSPLYCGSDATGWASTRSWDEGGLTLATAMAISGAAATPYSAVGGHGVTRSTPVSLAMGLLNLRLGYWAPNPDPQRAPALRMFGPSLLRPGLRQGLLGIGLSDRAPWIQLSDGGHFENLGIYELVRRKLDVIVVADASADPKQHFDNLATAIERVRVDFGAAITFDATHGLAGLLTGSAGDDAMTKRYELASRAHAIGRIRYRGADGSVDKVGVLVYLKAALFSGLPADVLSYKSTHPNFPWQSTGDQFFDEQQLEAYRELGYWVGRRMCEASDKPAAEGGGFLPATFAPARPSAPST